MTVILPAKQNDPLLEALVQKIGCERPEIVNVQPDNNLKVGYCWFNAYAKANSIQNGEVINGWAFWMIDTGIVAQHHAVCKIDGVMIDFTPNQAESDFILFSISDRHRYDYVNAKAYLSLLIDNSGYITIRDRNNQAVTPPNGIGPYRQIVSEEERSVIRRLVPHFMGSGIQ
ncbi:hypothetical protein [Gluconobacter kanchanaburiensis]|uniref:Uncharacterized protein n=1 Tax=Gluconobacter kanchanaburiensis NBRC 103587 TaxID=1307948 RepID=A0A511B9M0_9PROT|nr:hypothetical protein [Gluconobacter kanchanaburiensis]MBF0862740.1 hypothetical protein [Gluconobacter kanchanaburiensis]GBR69205.1 hypothetical protein AA103587_1195 [Gluconobacter kanchanaburiensis NBRC 103587]GEK97004.1 hypothetical protein GKA01_22010 [Gluconobacter kanchanaburiensis NBRC 103587]